MFRISVGMLPLRLRVAILSMFVAAIVLGSTASAAVLDLNVGNGDYNDSGNWIVYGTGNTTLVPTTADDAVVRNNGTLSITAADGNASAATIRIGAGAVSGDPAGPLFPPAPYGGGTLNWTGGNILGGANGPRLNVGERDNTNNINFTGIVNHSGGKISLNSNSSFLNIGANGTTPNPTSIYNLMPGGTIGLITGGGSNNGINVRNGTFNMTGGSFIHDDSSVGQRAMTVSSASGTPGLENVATADFSGGIVNVRGGMRMASTSHTKAYVNISGSADLKFVGNDFQIGANATNAYAEVNMSGGNLRVGDPAIVDQRRLIVGDSGTGVFNMSGGVATINHSLVVVNKPATAKGTFYQTGGTFTVRDIETNRDEPVAPDLSVETAAIIIDGLNAVFNQQDIASLSGETTIGLRGKGRFELRQGAANIRQFEVSNLPESRATLNVMGGKLTLKDGLIRNNVTNDGVNNNTPNLNLTGGELELAPSLPTMPWQSSMHLLGTDLDLKPGAIMFVSVGSFPNKPADFSLNNGSTWDIDIASNNLLTGADWIDVPLGTGALNGGLLTPHLLGGYTPVYGDTVRILRDQNGGAILNLAALNVSDPRWKPILAAGGSEIHLTYVPEPSAMLLIGIGVAMLSATRRMSRG